MTKILSFVALSGATAIKNGIYDTLHGSVKTKSDEKISPGADLTNMNVGLHLEDPKLTKKSEEFSNIDGILHELTLSDEAKKNRAATPHKPNPLEFFQNVLGSDTRLELNQKTSEAKKPPTIAKAMGGGGENIFLNPREEGKQIVVDQYKAAERGDPDEITPIDVLRQQYSVESYVNQQREKDVSYYQGSLISKFATTLSSFILLPFRLVFATFVGTVSDVGVGVAGVKDSVLQGVADAATAEAGRFLISLVQFVGDNLQLTDSLYSMVGQQMDTIATGFLNKGCEDPETGELSDSTWCKTTASLLQTDTDENDDVRDSSYDFLGDLEEARVKQQLSIGDNLIKFFDLFGAPFGHGQWVEDLGLKVETLGAKAVYAQLREMYHSHCRLSPGECGEETPLSVFFNEQLQRTDTPDTEEIQTWITRFEGLLLSQFMSGMQLSEKAGQVINEAQNAVLSQVDNPLQKLALSTAGNMFKNKVHNFEKQFEVADDDVTAAAPTPEEIQQEKFRKLKAMFGLGASSLAQVNVSNGSGNVSDVVLRKKSGSETDLNTENVDKDALKELDHLKALQKARFWENPKFDGLATIGNSMIDSMMGQPGYTEDLIGITSANFAKALSESSRAEYGDESSSSEESGDEAAGNPAKVLLPNRLQKTEKSHAGTGLTVVEAAMKNVVRKVADTYVENHYYVPDVPSYARLAVGSLIEKFTAFHLAEAAINQLPRKVLKSQRLENVVGGMVNEGMPSIVSDMFAQRATDAAAGVIGVKNPLSATHPPPPNPFVGVKQGLQDQLRSMKNHESQYSLIKQSQVGTASDDLFKLITKGPGKQRSQGAAQVLSDAIDEEEGILPAALSSVGNGVSDLMSNIGGRARMALKKVQKVANSHGNGAASLKRSSASASSWIRDHFEKSIHQVGDKLIHDLQDGSLMKKAHKAHDKKRKLTALKMKKKHKNVVADDDFIPPPPTESPPALRKMKVKNGHKKILKHAPEALHKKKFRGN